MRSHQISFFIKTLSILLFCFSANAVAETKWWEEGGDLLNNLLSSDKASELTVGDMGDGLKEALRVGTDTVVKQLGTNDGFNKDPKVHIPLPKSLDKVKSVLKPIGYSNMLDDLELKLNRSAEAATPKAKKIFWDAISQMTIKDVKGIFNGPDDAATRYLQAKMSQPLKDEMRPVVYNSMAEVGAIQSYDKMMAQYSAIPFVPDVKANLTDHVLQKALDGIFHYLAIEEASIRKNPAKRTTELLQRVFGSK